MRIINSIRRKALQLSVLVSFSLLSAPLLSATYYSITIDNQTKYKITVYSAQSYGYCTYIPSGGKPYSIEVGPRKQGVYTWKDDNNLFDGCINNPKLTSFKFITSDMKLLWDGRIGMIVRPSWYYGFFYAKQYCAVDFYKSVQDGSPPPSYIRVSINSNSVDIKPLSTMLNGPYSNLSKSYNNGTITLTNPPEGTVLAPTSYPYACWD
ncbi:MULTISPECIES: hypothetical protein [Photorhabdus]|uniref:hypothetical protein n=1 Tax=Photorhabdus TaxID=29487 RepID=UPI001CEDE6A1|nr:hypothetical protein [Photorhabdus antumapuensis]MCA6222402.1 hypothetical protein [Photorhabdus antumapuensis]